MSCSFDPKINVSIDELSIHYWIVVAREVIDYKCTLFVTNENVERIGK